MKSELIRKICETNAMLQDAKKRLIETDIKIIQIPQEWFYDDLDESLSEMELINYLYTKWLFYKEHQESWKQIGDGIRNFILDSLLPRSFNEPFYIIEEVYHLERETGLFALYAFEDIFEGKSAIEEIFGNIVNEKK